MQKFRHYTKEATYTIMNDNQNPLYHNTCSSDQLTTLFSILQCFILSVIQPISSVLTKAVGTVKIETPKSDYCLYEYKSELLVGNPYDELSHIVEIYNFPAEFKTEDLITIFNAYKSGGFEIKWVDDTHALGVFSSSLVAADVLAMNHPFVKIRPLSQGTAESKAKARRCAEFMQPYRTRPETCAALARRLVTGALGVRLKTAREEREAEKKVLKEARERRRLAAQQREDAWEGTFRSNS